MFILNISSVMSNMETMRGVKHLNLAVKPEAE